MLTSTLSVIPGNSNPKPVVLMSDSGNESSVELAGSSGRVSFAKGIGVVVVDDVVVVLVS
jgi:hypothetical protein